MIKSNVKKYLRVKKEIKYQKKKYIIYLRGIKTKNPEIIKLYIWG